MTNFPSYIQTFAMTTAFSKISAISRVLILFYFRFKFCKGLTYYVSVTVRELLRLHIRHYCVSLYVDQMSILY